MQFVLLINVNVTMKTSKVSTISYTFSSDMEAIVRDGIEYTPTTNTS